MKAQASPPSNLPVQLTSFVGREPEIEELGDVLRHARLVTIAGAAGMGKTRLAVELAARARAEHPDGVWFVGLAALADPSLVAREVATGVGMRERFGEPASDTLPGFIGSRRVLVLLDNCEHMLEPCARLAESLLRACPQLRILATSHEPLRVPGERLWRITPLGLPRPNGTEPAAFDEQAGSEAVRLFQARASLVQAQFELAPANIATVARICRRLDGIPLAIELAAARIEMMSIEDILDRLEDRFRLLTGGSRTAMPRHQTLRAALDWGHQLLNDEERTLFRRLSVFPGSVELAAAEAVCAGASLPPEDVMGHLSRLVDKSLVVPEAAPAGHTRYRMLETVRQYAAERLLEAGEGDGVRLRHAEHFLAVAEHATAYQRRQGHMYWLERLEADHDDLRAALQWCRAHDHGRWVRLALAMGWFWLVRGHLSEGREWLQGVLALPSLSALERAHALFWLARMLFWQGEYQRACELGERSLAGFREQGHEVMAGWALSILGSIHTYVGEDERGRACFEQALAATQDVQVQSDALLSMGELLMQRGELEAARGYLERGLSTASRGDMRWHASTGLIFLAILDYFDHNYDSARRRIRVALDALQQMGTPYSLSAALYVTAGLALPAGDAERALRLGGAASAAREALRTPLAPRWRAMVRSVVIEPATARLPADRAEAAWAEGERMSLAEAVAYALADPAMESGAARPAAAGSASSDLGPLSRREREVAMLVARGMTNRQIAAQLVIAERTVEGHVERIRGKLGVHSRTQIAVWVVGRGWLVGLPSGTT